VNDKAIVLLTALTVLLIALTPFHTRAQSTSNQQTPGSNTSGPRIKIAWAGMQARQLQKKLPGYPEEAKDKAIQGRVRLSILVGKDGKVEEVRLLSGDPALGNPAADEVRQWQFQPISLNGQALVMATELDLEFRLRKGKAEVRCLNAGSQQRGH